MKKVSKRIWWIAIPAVLTVLIFQLYWLRQTYLSQQEAFLATVTEIVKESYDQSVLQSVRILSGPEEEESYVFKATVNVNVTNSDSAKIKKQVATAAQPDTISVDSSHAPDLTMGDTSPYSHFISTVFTSFTNAAPNKDSLRVLLQKEFRKKGITIPFQLFVTPKEIKRAKPQVTVNPALSNQHKVVAVQFTGITLYLLKKMSSAIILSLFIALLITGCIWILWRIILKQEKLDNMRRDFISHVTHELKTPVAILKATNESLLTFHGRHDKEKTERYLRHSKDELDKLQGLIEKIMQLTKLEQTQLPLYREEISIKELLGTAVARFAYQPEAEISMHYNIAQPYIYTDREAMDTILVNLLDNAIKYNDKLLKRVRVSVTEHPTSFSFAIADNGNGIEKQHYPFLFDKFYRVIQGDRLDTKGYGLGLSHVRALLVQMNGHISVDSTPGEGTTFTFQIPKNEKDQAPAGRR